jgi:hypothetical protein
MINWFLFVGFEKVSKAVGLARAIANREGAEAPKLT